MAYALDECVRLVSTYGLGATIRQGSRKSRRGTHKYKCARHIGARLIATRSMRVSSRKIEILCRLSNPPAETGRGEPHCHARLVTVIVSPLMLPVTSISRSSSFLDALSISAALRFPAASNLRKRLS